MQPVRIYTAQEGDSLEWIAFKLVGDVRRAGELAAANPQRLGVGSPGARLFLPASWVGVGQPATFRLLWENGAFFDALDTALGERGMKRDEITKDTIDSSSVAADHMYGAWQPVYGAFFPASPSEIASNLDNPLLRTMVAKLIASAVEFVSTNKLSAEQAGAVPWSLVPWQMIPWKLLANYYKPVELWTRLAVASKKSPAPFSAPNYTPDFPGVIWTSDPMLYVPWIDFADSGLWSTVVWANLGDADLWSCISNHPMLLGQLGDNCFNGGVETVKKHVCDVNADVTCPEAVPFGGIVVSPPPPPPPPPSPTTPPLPTGPGTTCPGGHLDPVLLQWKCQCPEGTIQQGNVCVSVGAEMKPKVKPKPPGAPTLVTGEAVPTPGWTSVAVAAILVVAVGGLAYIATKR